MMEARSEIWQAREGVMQCSAGLENLLPSGCHRFRDGENARENRWYRSFLAQPTGYKL